MKQCTQCRETKDISEFASHPTQGTQSCCKLCQRAVSAEWYKNNKKRQQKNVQLNKQRLKECLVEHKRRLSCSVCSESESICLDFHHLDPKEKDFNIAEASFNGKGWSTILKEINKCVVLCSNCHRKVHAGIIQI